MLARRAPIAAAVFLLSLPGVGSAELVAFHDGFESGTTCPWSASVGGSSCSGYSRLYAHTGQNLYRIDTGTSTPVLIGPFDTGGPSIVDLAVDRDDNLYAISLAKLWSIDVATGAATAIGDFTGSAQTALAFVPLDSDDPQSEERLVAADAEGDVYEVNRSTGATTLLGNYGSSQSEQIRSSGDLVSIRGLGTFATVNVGSDFSLSDDLAEIDTTTWAATIVGEASTGYNPIVGLGYWDGAFFGFVDDGGVAGTGTMITIDPVTGAGSILVSGDPRWFGAGVTTDAPVPP